MAKSIKLPSCPYCHKRISYIGSMFLKTKGEYNCPRCNCISNIVINRSAYAIASTVCIAALLIVVLYTISGDHSSFLGIACVLAPFLIFYISVPFFVQLVPCKDKSAVKKIMDKTVSELPNEMAYQAAVQSSTKPVLLDVEEDFSAKFLKAKKNNSRKTLSEEENEQGEKASSDEPEDIQNTRIAFEINHETQMMAVDRELFPQNAAPSPETPVPEKVSLQKAAPIPEEEPISDEVPEPLETPVSSDDN